MVSHRPRPRPRAFELSPITYTSPVGTDSSACHFVQWKPQISSALSRAPATSAAKNTPSGSNHCTFRARSSCGCDQPPCSGCQSNASLFTANHARSTAASPHFARAAVRVSASTSSRLSTSPAAFSNAEPEMDICNSSRTTLRPVNSAKRLAPATSP